MHTLLTLSQIRRDSNEHYKSLVDEYREHIEKINKEIHSRLETWRLLLGKYYKMSYFNKNLDKTCVSYIFPYDINESNNSLWMLEIVEDNNYNGGVKDISHFVDENWNHNITLKEITEEEFRQKAIESTKHVIDRRLKRIEEEKSEE